LAKLQARAWLAHALCAPGQHAARRRKKCTRQSRSCLQLCQIFTEKNSLVPSATGYRPTSIVHEVGLHAANDLVEDDSIELARRAFWS